MGNETSRSIKTPHSRQPTKFENAETQKKLEDWSEYCKEDSTVKKSQQQPPLLEKGDEALTGKQDNRSAKGGSTSQEVCGATGASEKEKGVSVNITETANVSQKAKKRGKRQKRRLNSEEQMRNTGGELSSCKNLEEGAESGSDDDDCEVASQPFTQPRCGNEKVKEDGLKNKSSVTCSSDVGVTTPSPKGIYIDPRKVQIGQIIGEGGFGRVFNATLNGVTKVVSKLILVPFTVSEEELQQLMSLKHRNFVTAIGIVRQSDEMDPPQLILQYYPEGNLLQFLKNDDNPNDNGTLGKLAFDISEGCQFLHSSNVVHGNLAARNILIQKIPKDNKIYYNAKISDFGIIRYAEPSGGNYVKVPGSENRVVPLRWVPKEIVDGSVDDLTFSSDVWSFGVVLWEMWTKGEIPYGATSSNPKIIQFLNDGYSPLTLHPPRECPKNFVAVMELTFQVDPMKRPTFTEILVKLQHFKGHYKVTPGTISGAVVGGTIQSPHEIKPTIAAGGKVQGDSKNLEGDRTHVKKKEMANTNNSQNARGTNVESETVEELRKRVAQLENERRGGGRGHTGPGRGAGAQGQDKRCRTKPNSGRGGGGGRRGGERGSSGVGRGGETSSPAPPPYMPAPPPPYTEAPLPYHTSPHSLAPPPPYGSVQAGAKKEDDTIAKIKRLEAEMALLKAEKRMQEVAELMKVAAGTDQEGASQFNLNSGTDQYCIGAGSYGAANHTGPGHHHGGGQFRPYHKPRGGGGRAGGRAGHHNEANY